MSLQNEIKVSIIIPVLNGAKTIRRCLDSVATQTLNEIEVIVVDAGSDDGTREIVGKFIKTDSRVHILDSEKKSYGFQVNRGTDEAKGFYIGIVEPDDTVLPGMFDALYKAAEESNAEYVKADYYEVFRKSGERQRHRMTNGIEPDTVAIWSGIYRKDFLKKNRIRMNETPGASFQDTGFHILTYVYAKKTDTLNEPYYEYTVDNPESSVFQSGKWRCMNDEMRYVMRTLHELSPKQNERLYYVFYRKYRRNRERVVESELEDFYAEFSEDFKAWGKRFGEPFLTEFSDEERDELVLILQNGASYVKKVKEDREAFLAECEEYDAVFIYGAGYVGKQVERDLKKQRNTEVLGFLRTDTILTEKNRLQKAENNAAVVIASKKTKDRYDMAETAQKLGMTNIIHTPFGVY